MKAVATCLWVVAGLVACGGGGGGGDADDDARPSADAAPVSSCDPPGHFGVPSTTFTLPVTSGSIISYVDVQAAFPEVDFQTLDRLYIPAGNYPQVQLGNLPVRSADRPLIITNLGGQVRIGGSPTGNYIWSMGGGANWILTGRYDAESQTGNVDFPGHACGNYAATEGTYGIISDDEFAFDAPYLHMGLAVGGATDFELEYLEITRSGFAGIRLLNPAADGLNKPMANVRVHDTYVHDVAGEGYYFGWTGTPPSNLFPGLQVYNNRILRTGNEALQIQDVGDGSRIYNNSFMSGGTRWFDNELGKYQDNLSQVSVREGDIEFHHNVFIDGAGSLVSFFSSPQTGDGERQVRFIDNYFANALSLGIYMGGTAGPGSSFTFTNNTFRDVIFGFDQAYPAATDPGVIIRRGDDLNGVVTATGNYWDGQKQLVNGVTGADGTNGSATLAGNVIGPPALISFVDASPIWTEPGRHLSYWAPIATVDDNDPPVTFMPGDVVQYGSDAALYRCVNQTSGAAPPSADFTSLPRGNDDVRVAPGTDYAGYGVQ